ncbi:hypothetical protein Pan44_05390 [Caulifigura coniformis]|uniref:Uncharacterized protein n=2 Tax=Caulifigura coniformis TaxID=2527983 RepID=A0A517S8R6_9PLAN|nr:hypothetical protein Pan44_05390 [Caulifigura coniformis]
MFTGRLMVAVGFLIANFSSLLPADEPAPPANPGSSLEKSAQFTRPELIAIAWASPRPETEQPAPGPVVAWRPDGSPLPAEEVAAITKELPGFGAPEFVESEGLHPLHLVFRIDARATNSQRLTPGLVVGTARVETLAAQEGSSAGRLALAQLVPSQKAVAKWPSEISVEVRVPIEEGDVFKSVSPLPDAPVDVAPGVRLYWTRAAAESPSGRKILPAVALSIDRSQTDLVEYDFFTHLKDGTTESFNASQPTPTHDVRISHPLESRDVVEKIDLWRLRYRRERYDRLPVFPDRIGK